MKEESIGHIQKQMGATLQNYKNNCKCVLLSDGAERLTDKVLDRIQTYNGNIYSK